MKGQFRMPQPQQDPRQRLVRAVNMMGAFLEQLDVQERTRFVFVKRLLDSGGQPTREMVMALQQDYQRLKTTQESILGHVEENAFHLVGMEAEAAQAARVQLDGGNLLTKELMQGLIQARARIQLPTILEGLEAHSAFLSDNENQLLHRAKIIYDIQGALDPKLLQEVYRMQQGLASRQFIF